MGFMGSVAQNTGNIEKAIIEIMDLRERDIIEKDAIKIVGGQGGITGSSASFSQNAMGSLTNSGVLTDAVSKMVGMKDDEKVNDTMLQSIALQNWKRYQVKFNPNSLHLSGHSGGMVQKSEFGKDNGLEYSRGSTTIMMSVQLLFDACDPQDAFMGDKSNLSPTSVATGAAKAFLSGTGNKTITVQPEVEGFIGAIRNRYTRIITFNWGNISYSGSLRNVRAQYSMFNPTGDPVRATVDLSIMCADDDELSGASLAVWQERYKSAFINGSESFAYSNGDAKSFMDKGKSWLGGQAGMLLNL